MSIFTNNYNFILDTDSYKVGHPNMYGRKISKNGHTMKLVRMYDYLGPRVGGEFPEIVTAGVQHVAKILGGIRITKKNVDEAQTFYTAHLGPTVFDRTPWDVVVNKYGGCLPLRFCALPEGTIVPLGTPMVTVESTDENCPTLVSHFEALIQKYVWYMSTVATKSLEFSKTIYSFWKTCVDKEVTDAIFEFIHHDFGHRATTSTEASQLGGAAHLYISLGSDTVPGVKYIMDNMGESDGNGGVKMPGFSVVATEHSVMTSRGRLGEMDVLDDVLDSTPSNAILSCVADSYDLLGFVQNVTTGDRKNRIMARDGGKFVIRPDSNLIKESKKLSSAETVLECLTLMETNLSKHMTTNNKGFKVLPKQYGMIIGDGLNIKKVRDILQLMVDNMWSPQNMVFGTGGNLLQVDINRDVGNFAMKASELEFLVESEDGTTFREVHKIGKETPGKESIKGRVQVSLVDGKYVTVPEGSIEQANLLRVMCENGQRSILDHIGTIRQRIKEHRNAMDY